MPARLDIEESALQQGEGDAGLAVFVETVVEGLAFRGQEGLDVRGHGGIAARLAIHGHVQLAHAHRFARRDGEAQTHRIAFALKVGRHLGVVIAERLKAFAQFPRRQPQQVIEAAFAELVAARRGLRAQQRQLPARIGL